MTLLHVLIAINVLLIVANLITMRRLRRALILVDARQAVIDRLMIEHCPDEMTAEQLEEWARHQVPAGPEASAALDRAAGVSR